MAVNVSINGDANRLKQMMRQDQSAAEKAATQTMREVSLKNKLEKRKAMRAAGFSARLANSVRGKVYPSGAVSMAAAAVVQSAAHFLHAFTEGAVIRAKNGRYLAIPTGFNRVQGRRQSARQQRDGRWKGVRMTPEQLANDPMSFVKPGPSGVKIWFIGVTKAYTLKQGRQRLYAGGNYLIGSGQTKRGEKILEKGGGAIPMFILVPQVRLKQRLRFASIDDKYARILTRMFFKKFEGLIK